MNTYKPLFSRKQSISHIQQPMQDQNKQSFNTLNTLNTQRKYGGVRTKICPTKLCVKSEIVYMKQNEGWVDKIYGKTLEELKNIPELVNKEISEIHNQALQQLDDYEKENTI